MIWEKNFGEYHMMAYTNQAKSYDTVLLVLKSGQLIANQI